VTPPSLIRLGVELPGDVREALVGIRRSWPAGARWLAPEGLFLTLWVASAPGPEALDAVALVVERIAGRFAPFTVRTATLERLETPNGTLLVTGIDDPTGTLERLRRAVHESLTAYGFEAADTPASILLGRLPDAPPEPLPSLGPPREIPVRALVREMPGRSLPSGRPSTGTVPLSMLPAEARAAADDRERAELDAELGRRLAALPKRPAPRAALARPGRTRTRPDPAVLDEAASAGDDDDEPDDTAD
jgi:hypothetical protein